MTDRLAGVVLAAGAGTRLRPLTLTTPKPLVRVGGVTLLDRALDRLEPLVGTGSGSLAVNAHHLADRVEEHLRGRGVHLSREDDGPALGTAGALGRLRGWLAGRDVLVTNADAYLPAGLGAFTTGWDGARCRLLCTVLTAGERPDFVRADGAPLRYVGACLLPAALVAGLEPVPSGLYEVLWRDAAARGTLDLVTGADVGADGPAVDCGTPDDLRRAERVASVRHS